jgi:hypothetical protein
MVSKKTIVCQKKRSLVPTPEPLPQLPNRSPPLCPFASSPRSAACSTPHPAATMRGTVLFPAASVVAVPTWSGPLSHRQWRTRQVPRRARPAARSGRHRGPHGDAGVPIHLQLHGRLAVFLFFRCMHIGDRYSSFLTASSLNVRTTDWFESWIGLWRHVNRWWIGSVWLGSSSFVYVLDSNITESWENLISEFSQNLC